MRSLSVDEVDFVAGGTRNAILFLDAPFSIDPDVSFPLERNLPSFVQNSFSANPISECGSRQVFGNAAIGGLAGAAGGGAYGYMGGLIAGAYNGLQACANALNARLQPN